MCIFAAAKPSQRQTQLLIEITDTLQYSCGASLTPDDHPLIDVFVIKQDISCGDPRDKHNYSCRKFEYICCCSLRPDSAVGGKRQKTESNRKNIGERSELSGDLGRG